MIVHIQVSVRRDSRSQETVRVIMRKTNRGHMTGDHHGRTASRAALLVTASSDRCRAPQRLLARAITGYVEGVLPAQAIATLRGISLDALVEELSEAGVTPAERPIAWADPAELPDVQVDLAALDADLAAAADDDDQNTTTPRNAR